MKNYYFYITDDHQQDDSITTTITIAQAKQQPSGQVMREIIATKQIPFANQAIREAYDAAIASHALEEIQRLEHTS
ncbi:hypothetical protein [Bifidobacterium xylocopae]|uniref:Uncharacterized protein n=1 Tax=Bifidobacterium xylocopae TaxID=2493119 RepID=A0A366KB36_9BIFI|nr:hypothetical protein [Bifidobacterium xylocopae]RBP98904.1 hypothetical protein CRD59_06615 [Bifidobacterium xylocopae]